MSCPGLFRLRSSRVALCNSLPSLSLFPASPLLHLPPSLTFSPRPHHDDLTVSATPTTPTTPTIPYPPTPPPPPRANPQRERERNANCGLRTRKSSEQKKCKEKQVLKTKGARVEKSKREEDGAGERKQMAEVKLARRFSIGMHKHRALLILSTKHPRHREVFARSYVVVGTALAVGAAISHRAAPVLPTPLGGVSLVPPHVVWVGRGVVGLANQAPLYVRLRCHLSRLHNQ